MLRTQEQGMYVREAPGDGPTMLWIHGLGESGLCFESIVMRSELAGFRHLIPDLPGYGRSLWRDPAPDFAGMIDHLTAWLDDRREGQIVLVGHSLGGVLATLFAETHPERVRAVVNIDGNTCEADCSFSGPAAAVAYMDFEQRVFPDLRERIYHQGRADMALRGYYTSLKLCDPVAFHAHAGELVAASRSEQLPARLAALPMPHLYLLGSPNGVSEQGLSLLEAAGVSRISISPAGHWPFHDRPRPFAGALRDFLGS